MWGGGGICTILFFFSWFWTHDQLIWGGISFGGCCPAATVRCPGSSLDLWMGGIHLIQCWISTFGVLELCDMDGMWWEDRKFPRTGLNGKSAGPPEPPFFGEKPCGLPMVSHGFPWFPYPHSKVAKGAHAILTATAGSPGSARGEGRMFGRWVNSNDLTSQADWNHGPWFLF